jgi:predicted MFS family arabinose efflux permease
LSKPAAGVIASANFLGYLVGAIAASSAALAGGRRRWLIAALTVSAITTGVMGVWSSLPVFLVLRFVGGVASAFVMVFASTLVLDHLATAARSGLAALHFAGVGCGIAVSAVLVAGLAASGFDWRVLWFASGVFSLLALGVVIGLIPHEEANGPAAAAARKSAIDRRLVALIVAYGLFGFGYVITATFISTIVRAAAELRLLEPVIWLVVGLTAAPSVALWTWAGRRVGNERALALACLAEGVGVALSVLANGMAAIVVAAALLGGTFVGITALGLIHARHLATGDPRRSLAYMTAAFGLGQMVGPTFAGFAYDFGDSFLLPSLVAAVALVVASVLVMDLRPGRAEA